MVPLADGFPARIVPRLDEASSDWPTAGLPLTVGVSTRVATGELSRCVPRGITIRAAHGRRRGVSLSGMTAFDYLTLRPTPTASG